MIEQNLFGETQKYPPSEDELRIINLKAKIKKLIKQNGDYEFYSDLWDDKPPQTFDEFFSKQIDHLMKTHDQSKDWDDFLMRYNFI
jgi:hypothetical protein